MGQETLDSLVKYFSSLSMILEQNPEKYGKLLAQGLPYTITVDIDDATKMTITGRIREKEVRQMSELLASYAQAPMLRGEVHRLKEGYMRLKQEHEKLLSGVSGGLTKTERKVLDVYKSARDTVLPRDLLKGYTGLGDKQLEKATVSLLEKGLLIPKSVPESRIRYFENPFLFSNDDIERLMRDVELLEKYDLVEDTTRFGKKKGKMNVEESRDDKKLAVPQAPGG